MIPSSVSVCFLVVLPLSSPNLCANSFLIPGPLPLRLGAANEKSIMNSENQHVPSYLGCKNLPANGALRDAGVGSWEFIILSTPGSHSVACHLHNRTYIRQEPHAMHIYLCRTCSQILSL